MVAAADAINTDTGQAAFPESENRAAEIAQDG
jgi:hypothetical protein